MKINNINNKQPCFKAGANVKVTQDFINSIKQYKYSPAARANLAQEVLDTVNIVKKAASVIGEESDEIELLYYTNIYRYLKLLYNQQFITNFRFDFNAYHRLPGCQMISNKIIYLLTKGDLNYFDVRPSLLASYPLIKSKIDNGSLTNSDLKTLPLHYGDFESSKKNPLEVTRYITTVVPKPPKIEELEVQTKNADNIVNELEKFLVKQ